jgi:hypothetical protein
MFFIYSIILVLVYVGHTNNLTGCALFALTRILFCSDRFINITAQSLTIGWCGSACVAEVQACDKALPAQRLLESEIGSISSMFY